MPTATKTILVSLRFPSMSLGRLPRGTGTSLASCWKAIWSREHRSWSRENRWSMARASPTRAWHKTNHWNCWEALRGRFGRGDDWLDVQLPRPSQNRARTGHPVYELDLNGFLNLFLAL